MLALKRKTRKTLRDKQPRRRYRVGAIVLTGVVCAVAVWWTPVRAQDAEGEETTTEQVQVPEEVDPQAATTTEDPTIPVEELRLLVQPLTLAELEIEAAAWLVLLKEKAKEISAAEITIKRENLAIGKQEEGANALEEAKKNLAEAEADQVGATPGSPEYEEAAKKVEEAKENLKAAQAAIEEAAETQQKIEEDETSSSALEKAEEIGELEAAKQAVEDAKKAREEMEAGSLGYEAATEKIDTLEAAIKDVEDAQAAQNATITDSPEHQEATQQLEASREALKKAREAIEGADVPDEQSSTNLDELTATLENTEVDADGEEKVAGPPEVGESQGELEEQQQQLEEAAEQLEENAEAESEEKNQLVVAVTELQEERTAIIDRFSVILDELEKKGGDPEFYRKYIQAVSGVELDITDTEGLGLRLLNWFSSEEGGLRWVNNTGKFLGVFIGVAIASQLVGIIVNQALSRLSNVSQLLRNFVVIVIQRGGILVAFLLALTALEVSLGPILALLGGVSFVLAFALQSNLGNLASGLMIMAYKPFDVGDEVKIGDLWCYVDSITLANTRLKGFGAQIYTVPNNTIWSSTIENLTTQDIRKGGLSLNISLETNLRWVKEILLEIGKSHPLTLDNPPPSIFPYKGSDYYVIMGFNFWTKTEDFWTAYEEILYTVQERLDKEGISIIPQQDIRIHHAATNGKTPELVSQMPVESLETQLSKSSTKSFFDPESLLDAEPSLGVDPDGPD
ncbi:MAG: mechanosensitive ion channel [Coleofasciculus chthonoplastes F3-SA18-01]|uniref:mechanosensitive ion channel domain-containing protein n=1 Tax=Coleofasciculus chthonoplastes TaxID=64178 RepID=UPI003305129A